MMNTSDNHALGDFLRARRQRLDPATFGFPAGRRRTPGCAAKRSRSSPASARPGIPAEQGRGGAPSREVLERIARGLRLTTPEREHPCLFSPLAIRRRRV
ncbi:helix-turn-helix domain-containing protein [Klebsiella pneumoniae subsp. pneumoniae]|nr:helix-turn-helix domain-containing protein [Klebsiella pneumoniae subsp. pneumoniae]